jgi:transcriptional regulator with XRE-family HTH domain
MAGHRCPIGARELAERSRRLREHVGRQIRDLRIEDGISQTRLAAATGIDQGHLSRIERGRVQPTWEVLVAIGACLGADLGVRYFPGSGPRLKDRFQAPIIEALIRILHARWIRYPELAVPKARGFVDLALGDRLGTGIECEAHTEIRALDELLRRQLEKALAVQELGVVGTNVSTLLVLRSTKLNRDVVRLHEATFAAAFPGRTRDALAALTSADAPWPGPTLLWAKLEGAKATILQTPPRGIRVGR